VNYWLNEEFSTAPALPANAGGTLLGIGAFTTVGLWNGRAFALDRHLARLRRDAARFDLEISFSDEILRAALKTLIRGQKIERGTARITATARGDGRWNAKKGCDVSVMAQSTVDIDRTLKIDWSPFRIEARRATAGVKSTSYADNFLAWREAQGRGLDDAICCNSSGAVCETTRANIFWTRNGVLFTPSLESGALPGIGRELVLEWARAEGILAREGVFSPTDVSGADAIFLSGAATGVRAAAFPDETAAPDEVFTIFARRWHEEVQK
jgi:branched-chain amino acid aminotransferase